MEDQWPEVEQTEYDAACDSCEVWVTLRTKEEHTSVRAVLKFDQRKQGAHGRALQKDIPSLGLLAEDRLEPHPGMPDVADFDSLNSFPVRVLFWRVSEQTRTRHRNPLFWPQTGVTTDALAIDILHTLHLGVILYFSSEVVWALLLGNIFGIAGGADDILHMGVFRIRDRLFAWYNQWDAAHPERPACRLGNFTVQMLGDRAHPRLHVRAAESYWMFLFVLDLLRDHADKIDNGRILLVAGESLIEYLNILKQHGSRLPPDVPQRLLDLCKKYLLLMQKAGCHNYPKHHLWCHMTLRSSFLGNPRSYGTCADESANGNGQNRSVQSPFHVGHETLFQIQRTLWRSHFRILVCMVMFRS
jgi:hypothetical protein